MDLSRAGPGPGSKVVCVVLCSGLFWGCTLQLPEYDAAKSLVQPVSVEREGISVTLHPLNSKDADHYFGVDLLDKGFVPVFVSVENRNPSSSFVLSARDFSIVGASAKVDEVVEANHESVGSLTAGAAVSTVAAICILPPLTIISIFLMPTGAKMLSNAMIVKHAFRVREWQRTTISPGEVKTGFVYLPVTSGANPTVRIRGLQLPSRRVIELEATFQGE